MKTNRNPAREKPGDIAGRRASVGDGGKAVYRPVILTVAVIAVLGLGAALYSHTLHGPFMFDDYPNILENPHIRVEDPSIGNLVDAGIRSVAKNRPVANISFALNYYVHQYDQAGYRAVNIAIHLLAGLALFFLIKTTVIIARERTSGPGILEGLDPAHVAFFAMLVWVVHPLHTQSVTYIVQRMNSMASMFYILSMLCYVRGRLGTGRTRWGLYLVSIVTGALAIGSKEIATTLPFFILLYEWYFFRDLSWEWARRQVLPVIGIIAFVLLLLVLFAGVHFLQYILVAYYFREFTMLQRVLTELGVVVFYLSQILLPHPSRLNLEHDFPLSNSLFEPATAASLGLIVVLLALAAVTARKNRLLSFAILWFFGNLAIESSFIGLEIIFDHRTYLPSIFVIALLAAAALRYIRPRWAGMAALCVVAGVFSLWTYQRNEVLADELMMARDCAHKSPNLARPNNNLALVLVKRGDLDEAIVHFKRAIELAPDRYAIYKNLADALAGTKRHDEALEYYRQGLVLAEVQDKAMGSDDRKQFHLGMGNSLDKLGRHEEAREQYAQALAIDPGLGIAYNLMGMSYAEEGMSAEALDQFARAVDVNPNYAEAHNNMGNVHARQGNLAEALGHYRNAIGIRPDYADAYYNMANILRQQGKDREAIRHYREAVRINPGHVNARNTLAALLYERGDLDGAVEQFRELIRLDSGNETAQENLDLVLRRKEGIDAARVRTLKALDADPVNAQLHHQMGELNRMAGDLNAAIESYQKAIAISPGFTRALEQLAFVYSLAGDYANAIATMEKVIELKPADPDAYYNIACLYSLQDSTGEAVQWLLKAVDRGFRDWDLLKNDRDMYNVRCTSFYKEYIRGK
jgi:tetratricopeptide (TPR) repeat protein